MCSPVPAVERLRAIQASGYRCEHSTGGYVCRYRAGLAVRVDGRVLAVCFLHYPLYEESP